MFEGLEISEAFASSITRAIKKGMLSHALILEGGDENTRFSAAREIAKAVLCEGESKPCGVCSKCRKVESGSHPDIHVLEKEEKSSMIKIEPIRELKKKALVFPNDGNKSVFIINGAEHMNIQAQNAFLKLFEEPAKHLLFILCCETKSSLLETIISRATLYSLGADNSKGSKSSRQDEADSLADSLLKLVADGSEVEFLRKISVFQKDKELFRLCLQSMTLILRDSIVLQQGVKEMSTPFTETAKRLSLRLTSKKILELVNATGELYRCSKANSNHNLTVARLSSLFYGIKSN